MIDSIVVCLVPQLPPSIDGVGDYAISLAKKMRQIFDVNTHFIVCNPSWQGEGTVEGFSVTKLRNRTTAALLNELQKFPDGTSVFVNYVLHAYAARGCPFWLVDALTTWRKNTTQSKLVTMFHEAYPDLRGPWSTDFWLQPIQRRLSSNLSSSSDHVLVTCSKYLNSIRDATALESRKIEVLPVISTIGELSDPLPLSCREPRLIIFGKVGNKANAYRALESAYDSLLKIGVEEIYDIGPSPTSIQSVGQIPIVKLGQTTSSAINEILSKSRFGFLSYQRKALAKSSIFAAYCSHGLATLNFRRGIHSNYDGLSPDIHYLTAESKGMNGSQLQLVADNAYAWYQEHNQLQHAAIWSSKILLDGVRFECSVK